MTTPKTLYETASYELNKFRERRMAERRATQRDTPDRRVTGDTKQVTQEPTQDDPARGPSDPA